MTRFYEYHRAWLAKLRPGIFTAMAIVLALLALIAALAALVLASYQLIFRRALPRTTGDIHVPGLHGPVEIRRDRQGVPHIRAADSWDAAFAVGFVHGQDRLWQMELHRRIAAGRLSEVMGRQGIAVDQLMRKLGLRRVSEAEWHVTQASGELRRLLEAYTAGVNAAMRDRPLAAEFVMLRHRPEPWQPEDCLAVGRLLSFTQSGNWEAQLIRMRMLKELGPELTGAIDPGYPAANPWVEAGLVEVEWGSDLLAMLRGVEDLLPLSSWAAGSNTWAVHGTRTATGKPILANDPHGVLGTPSSWHQVHVETPEDEIAGLAFLGTPFIAFGHNRRVAWGIVNSQVSTQSLYVERLNPNNPMQFQDREGWQDAVRFREVIRVRGARPLVEDVLVTRRGPVISNAIPGKQPPISLRWVGLDSEVDSLSWAMRLNRARDWKSFRFAVGSCAAPAMVVTYADTDGNIGFRLMGFIPIRPEGQGRLPLPGWDGSGEWLGFIPFEEVPEALNPASGFIIAANNPIAFARHPLVFEPATGYRARRCLEVVGANSSLTVADSVRLQGDVASLPGRALRDLVLERVGDADGRRDLALGLHLLREWDGQLDQDSRGGCVYDGLLEHLVERMIGDRLSPALREQVLRKSVHSFLPTGPFAGRLTPAVIEAVAEGRPAPGAAADRQRCDELLRECLAGAVADLARRHGSDPSRWRWGDEHQVLYQHPIAEAFGPLGAILSRGPFPGAGDTDTVRLMGHAGGKGPVSPATAAICRAVYDLADWSRSVISHSPGQSGHPASPNYGDMIDDYLAGRPRQMDFGPGIHERAPADTRLLRLLPVSRAENAGGLGA
jgi:penicillin amidase